MATAADRSERTAARSNSRMTRTWAPARSSMSSAARRRSSRPARAY